MSRNDRTVIPRYASALLGQARRQVPSYQTIREDMRDTMRIGPFKRACCLWELLLRDAAAADGP